MAPYIWLAFGSFLLSMTIGYACWARIRVVRLRLAIDAIRATLKATALRLNCLNDAAYLRCDKALGAMIDYADRISVFTMLYFNVVDKPIDTTPIPRSLCKDMNAAIEAAELKLGESVINYLWRETVSGMISWLASRIFPKSTSVKRRAQNAVIRSANPIVKTHDPLHQHMHAC
jgi:hypothetical protein